MGDFSLDSIADLPTGLYVGGAVVPASDGGRFDVYDPASQYHSYLYFGYEWFDEGDGFFSGGIVDFDMGSSMTINRVAIWPEESGGIETLNIYTSDDPLFGVSTYVGTFTLTDWPVTDYTADVLNVVDTTARYLRLEILTIPATSIWSGASMGEIAVAVPAPGAVGMLGLAGFAAARRRRT